MSEQTVIAAEETAFIPADSRTNIYLLPEQLTQSDVNAKARPNETPERRQARIKRMAKALRSDTGQLSPVRVLEIAEEGMVRYEYIDGGSRVDAIEMINSGADGGKVPKTPMNVWCSVVGQDEDTFKIAVQSNIAREGNTVPEIIKIINETVERHGWTGRGVNRKVADYLALEESRVSEYFTVAKKASPAVLEMMENGSISSLDAALKLVNVAPEKQESIAGRAQELAAERTAAQPAESTPATTDEPATAAATVTATDVRNAAAEQGESVGPMSKKNILDFFAEKCGPAYSESVRQFCEYFVESWAKGTGTDRTANKWFDLMTAQTPEIKAANKAKAKEAAAEQAQEEKNSKENAKKRGPKSSKEKK